MKNFMLAFLTLLFFSQLCYAQGDPILPEDQKMHLQKIDSLTSIINQQHHKNAELYLLRANQYIKLKNYTNANFDLDTALQIEPKYIRARWARALNFRDHKLWEQSIQECRLGLVSSNPKDSLYIHLLWIQSEGYQNMGRLDSALLLREKIIELEPTQPIHYIGMANLLADHNRHRDAIIYLKEATRIEPDNCLSYINISYYYGEIKEYQLGILYGDTAVMYSAKPMDKAVALNNRGFSKIYLRDVQQGLVDIEASLKLFPNNSFAHFNRGLAYTALEDKETACANFNRAIELGMKSLIGSWVSDYCK